MEKTQSIKINEWDKNVLNLGICQLILNEEDENEVVCHIKFLPGLGLKWRKDQSTDNKMKAMHDFFEELQKICLILQKIGEKYQNSKIIIAPHGIMKTLPPLEEMKSLNMTNLSYLKNKVKTNK